MDRHLRARRSSCKRGLRRWVAAHGDLLGRGALLRDHLPADLRLAALHPRPARSATSSGSSACRSSRFPIEAGAGFALFHALDFTALLLIVGLAIALWRRLTDAGLLATQRFGFDLVPLVLLFAIAVTGLALTASSLWWEGRFYWFISLVAPGDRGGLAAVAAVRQVLPHRPAPGQHRRDALPDGQPGRRALRRADRRPARCRALRRASCPPQQFVDDLKATLADLGQDYDLGDERGWLQDYCPTCKRVLRGQAYYQSDGKAVRLVR